MAMQYDVKSFHATASTLAYGDRTRLKGVVISPVTSTTFNSCVVDTVGALTGTYDIPGSTTCTITIANHGLSDGDIVGLNFTSGTAVDDSYVVANATTNTFNRFWSNSSSLFRQAFFHYCESLNYHSRRQTHKLCNY
jgi:hypothetical protein